MEYDLEERTAQFAEMIIGYCKSIKPSTMNTSVIAQLIKSATSIGANYREANAGSSKKDFRNKIYICKKEAQETEYWIRILKNIMNDEEGLLEAKNEVYSLVRIFGKIVSTIDNKKTTTNKN